MNEELNTKPDKRDDLWWDVLLVVAFHGILFALLLLFLWFIVPLIGALLGDFGGSLPWSIWQLIHTSGFAGHPLLLSVAAIVTLWIDSKAYRWLCMTHGKKTATLYATTFAGILVLAILWFGILFGMSVSRIAEWHQQWRLKTQAEQSAPPLPRAPQPGHSEGAR